MSVIREVTDHDVDQVRDLFVSVYGHNYPFKGFYDTQWLKKAVYDDNTMFLLMEMDNRVIATASITFSAGSLDDMIGEVGRLVASPDKKYRGKNYYVDFIRELTRRAAPRVQFLLGEARTIHTGSQKLSGPLEWIPVGFEPMKYNLDTRESFVLFGKLNGMARELRRNNPRVIPEAAVLAQQVLGQFDIPADVIVEDEVEGYPTDGHLHIEHLRNQRGVSSLLRIERGRVNRREIFGNFSLSHGFFRISDLNTNYLIARQNEAVLGAVGFSYDQIDSKIRIFELIEFDPIVKGTLLAAVDRVARQEYNVDYIEVDVSAYSPKIQRTFERLGFVATAYCPSMVFEQVERLDVIRMAKLYCPYDCGPIKLLDSCQPVHEIVERGFDEKRIGMKITDSTRNTDLFKGLPDGDLQALAKIAELKDYPAGTEIIHQGQEPKHLYILHRGAAFVRLPQGDPIANIDEGEVFGEMAIVDKAKRSADVVLSKDSLLISFPLDQLERLLQKYPRIGYKVVLNLARGLSSKIRKFH